MKRFFTLLTGLVLSLIGFSSLTYAAQTDASLELRPSVTQAESGQEFYVDIFVKNPSGQALLSVRSWLQYDPAHLEVTQIEPLDSPFTLASPDEDRADPGEKQIKIGYSNVSGGATVQEARVARVHFKVSTPQAVLSPLEFYDYQLTELGHTSVTVIDGGFPVNILSQKPEPLVLSLNGGTAAPVEEAVEVPPPIQEEELAPDPQEEERLIPPLQNKTFPEENTPSFSPPSSGGLLSPPLHLTANTRNGSVHLKWEAPADAQGTGYYLYYGKTSGLYTRRKTLEQKNDFNLDGLKEGETYYFAVTAYSTTQQESDYSNEVGLIVGEPLSSTHPFENKANQILAQVPATAQNGPVLNWFLLSTLGLGVMLGLGRKKPSEK